MLSVIVTCFNVEKYIARCLDSIVHQTYRDLEVIIIDDGSTDESRSIIKKFINKNSNWKLIQNPRSKGYGFAVNLGIRASTGRYFTAIDGDDILPPNAFELLMATATKYHSDYVRGNFSFCYQPSKIVPDQEYPAFIKTNHITNKPFLPLDYPSIFTLRPTVWSGVYKKSFFIKSKIKLIETPGASNSDMTFAHSLLACNPTTNFIADNVYFYRQHPDQSINHFDKMAIYLSTYDHLLNTQSNSKLKNISIAYLMKRVIDDFIWIIPHASHPNFDFYLAQKWLNRHQKEIKLWQKHLPLSTKEQLYLLVILTKPYLFFFTIRQLAKLFPNNF